MKQDCWKKTTNEHGIPVCANCHRMLHRRKTDNISVSEMQELESVKRIKEVYKEL